MKKYIRTLFATLFVGLLITLFCSSYCRVEAQDEGGSTASESARRYAVKTTPLATRTFEERLIVQGNVESKRYANVSARVAGTLDAVFVDEGDHVEEGTTKLFQVDQENLRRAVLLAEAESAVAECSVRESKANLETIEADLRKSQLDYDRFTRLVEKGAATQDALEKQRLHYEQITAQQKHAKALIDLNQKRLRQAGIALNIARKNLSDSVVVAPLTAVVTKRLLEPGEHVDSGTSVLRIEDTSLLEVVAFLPSQYYRSVEPGTTTMQVLIGNDEVGVFPLSYKSPAIDSALRTFEVHCLIAHRSDVLAPGTMVDVRLVLAKETGFGVPLDAIQIRADKQILFVVENNVARMITVKTGLNSDGWLHVDAEPLTEGMAVVSAGQTMLDDGVPVDVLKGTE